MKFTIEQPEPEPLVFEASLQLEVELKLMISRDYDGQTHHFEFGKLLDEWLVTAGDEDCDYLCKLMLGWRKRVKQHARRS